MSDIHYPVKRYRVIDNILLLAVKHLLNKELLVLEHLLKMRGTSFIGIRSNRLERLIRQMNIKMLSTFKVILGI